MNKVKIMLTSIAVLAGIGGALAFKVNAVRGVAFCISSKVQAGITTCTFTKMGKLSIGAGLTYATFFPAGVTRCTLANGGAGLPCDQVRFTTME